MKPSTTLVAFSFLLSAHSKTICQEPDKDWHIGLFTGTINYQGDLKPNSFTFNHSNPAVQFTARKPLSKRISIKTGLSIGKIEGADKYNRSYLKPRNLSFYTNIDEVFAGLELNLDNYYTGFSPYLYGGVSVFHFNPWTFDENGKKTYLKALRTEGQGLADYPDRKPYKLVQPAFSFGVGARYKINECLEINIEFSQRKTFTDYLDDVSTFYVDKDKLLAARGPKAVELAYRGDELTGGASYPHDGVQRGTPTEMDWYYYFGVGVEIKLTCLRAFLAGWRGGHASYSYFKSCPKPRF